MRSIGRITSSNTCFGIPLNGNAGCYNFFMFLTIEDVGYFAELARLDLKPVEKAQFRRQLSAILDHFRRLQEVNTEEVEPTSSVLSLESILREDESRLGLSLEDLLWNAPHKDHNQFRLPPVFE